jgi:hypothetical protein
MLNKINNIMQTHSVTESINLFELIGNAIKTILLVLLVATSSYSFAANSCYQTSDGGEVTPNLADMLVSSSAGEVCAKFAAKYAPYVISTSVQSIYSDRFGGGGYCNLELSAPYQTPYASISYSCSCAPPVLLVLPSGPEIANADCSTKYIGFFNGVSNTRESAISSLDRLRRELGTTYKKRPLEYELFYNQTACRTGFLGFVPCLEDVAEVFAQRNRELGGVLGDRWEIYWEMLAGRQNQLDSLTAGLLAGLRTQFGNAGNALLQLLDSIAANILNQLMGSFTKLLTLMSSPPTAADTASHVAKIKELLNDSQETTGMVLVAHSQGNLFVNAAYQLYATGPSSKVKVVHIAPASPTLSSSFYLLSDTDFVINGLRLTGINTVPRANIALPFSTNDKTGHSFEGTYMDTARAAYTEVLNIINYQLGQLKSYK